MDKVSIEKDDSIFVAGHGGLVGSAIVRALNSAGYENLILHGRDELDLTDGVAVRSFFEAARPRFVFLAAARVGGIQANESYAADFIRDNLSIQLNVIDSAYRSGVGKLLFLGSSCAYPRDAPQPIREEYLLTGPLESTNEWYAIAKIAGIRMCQAYTKQHGFPTISLMPTNVYGPGDNFDLESSHVLPALLRKFHEAKSTNASTVDIWGTGAPKREFLYVDDLADAALHLMQRYHRPDVINVGTGKDISIEDLARMIGRIVGYSGELAFDKSRPDGTPRKLLDVSKLSATGWRYQTELEVGIERTYRWFVESGDGQE